MPKPRPRRTAAEREARRIRIVAAIQNGFSYDEIAREEAIGHERVRQIVVETMRRNDEFSRDLRFVQAARLDPALKLTLKKIAAGKLEAVDRLIKILDRLDKYLAGAKTSMVEPDIRQKLMRKIEMACRQSEFERNRATPDVDPSAPASQPPENAENRQGIAWTSENFGLLG
jgi:hypothetical protein